MSGKNNKLSALRLATPRHCWVSALLGSLKCWNIAPLICVVWTSIPRSQARQWIASGRWVKPLMVARLLGSKLVSLDYLPLSLGNTWEKTWLKVKNCLSSRDLHPDTLFWRFWHILWHSIWYSLWHSIWHGVHAPSTASMFFQCVVMSIWFHLFPYEPSKNTPIHSYPLSWNTRWFKGFPWISS